MITITALKNEFLNRNFHVHPQDETVDNCKTPVMTKGGYIVRNKDTGNAYRYSSVKDPFSDELKDSLLKLNHHNFMWFIPEGFLVIDVDNDINDDKGTQSFLKLQSDLQEMGVDVSVLERTTTSPRGGFHIYLTLPESFQGHLPTTISKYPNVEFKTHKNKITLPLSKRNDAEYTLNEKYSDDFFANISEAPVELLSLLMSENRPKNTSSRQNHSEFSFEEVEIAFLKYLTPKRNPKFNAEPEWFKVCCALNHFDSTEVGFALWDKWSALSPKYDKEATLNKWNYVSENSKDNGKNQITVKSYMKDIIKQVRMDVVEVNLSDNPFQGWFHLSKGGYQGVFKNDTLNQSLSTDMFDNYFLCNESVPVGISASKFGVSRKLIPLVSHSKYEPLMPKHRLIPGQTRLFKDVNDVVFFNEYKPADYSVIPEEKTSEYYQVVKDFDMLLEILATKEHKSMLTDWLAFQIQHPGVRLNWHPIIKSINGVGKDSLALILAKCVGEGNFATFKSADLASKFNSFAASKTLCFCSELALDSLSRDIKDSYENLKTYTGNVVINCEKKGVDSDTVKNFANYLMFSNRSLPVIPDDQERRFFFLEVPFKTLSEVGEYIGESPRDFYGRIVSYTSMDNYDDSKNGLWIHIFKYLNEHQISQEFLDHKIKAPETEAWRNLLSKKRERVSGSVDIQDILNDGGFNYNNEVFLKEDLFNAYKARHPNSEVRMKEFEKVLTSLGYISLGRQIRVPKSPVRVRPWVKEFTSLTDEEIIQKLQQSGSTPSVTSEDPIAKTTSTQESNSKQLSFNFEFPEVSNVVQLNVPAKPKQKVKAEVKKQATDDFRASLVEPIPGIKEKMKEVTLRDNANTAKCLKFVQNKGYKMWNQMPQDEQRELLSYLSSL